MSQEPVQPVAEFWQWQVLPEGGQLASVDPLQGLPAPCDSYESYARYAQLKRTYKEQISFRVRLGLYATNFTCGVGGQRLAAIVLAAVLLEMRDTAVGFHPRCGTYLLPSASESRFFSGVNRSMMIKRYTS